ncbi:MAG TPA: YqeG family HAD IIIA-type phosphatase [Bacilli bacterium]|nr:YqeG family HAD IIIA-type phosphatase [Bacilli bacterium]
MNIFKPNKYFKDIYSINYNLLKKEGIKLILFDLDNTICPPKEMILEEKLKNLFIEIKSLGIECLIFSNSINKKKLIKFSDYYDINYIGKACKPLSYNYRKVIRKYKLKNNEVCSIGDQLVTDIFGGNKMKIKTILVDPISKIDEKMTLFNRCIEKFIFKLLLKKGFKKGKYYY